MTPGSIFKLSVSTFSVVFIVGLFIEYRSVTSDLHSATLGDFGETSAEVESLEFRMANLLEFKEVLSKPLFFERRKLWTEEELGARRDQRKQHQMAEEPFTIVVSGIVIADGKRMAVVRNTVTKEEYTLFQGGTLPEKYSDWMVAEVEERDVLVSEYLQRIGKSESSESSERLPASTKKKKWLKISEEGVHFEFVDR